MIDGNYEGLGRIVYGDGATFIPVCPECGRFCKADKEVLVNGMGEMKDQPNGTCKKHGRIKMPFEGWI